MDKLHKEKGIYIEGLNSGNHYILFKPKLHGIYKYRVLYIKTNEDTKDSPVPLDEVQYLSDFKFKKDALSFIDAYENLMPNPSVGTAYQNAVPMQNR
jgi:hypothetical protein